MPPRLPLLLLLAAVAPALSAVAVDRLLVDSLDAPLGIASTTPAFTWTVVAGGGERNVTQTAHQLTLSATAGGPAGDVWDSGVVAGDASAAVGYGGPPLEAGQVYYARVRVWTTADGGRAPCPYSPPARFSVGLQSAADWRPGSAFVGLEPAGVSTAPWLRSSVALTAGDLAAVAGGRASALVHVASAGYHGVYVNGVQLGGGSVLAPSVANLGVTLPAVTYDAAAALVVGENVLGLWLGAGWAAYPPYGFNKGPLAVAELRITPAAGGAGAGAPNVTLGTDGTWRARNSTRVPIGAWNSGDFGGERLDWRLDVPGWATAAVDASGWAPAAVTALDDAGGRTITPQCLEPTVVLDDVRAAAVTPCPGNATGGCYVITMASLFSGWLTLAELSAAPGATVTLQYTTVPGGVVEYHQVDEVVLGPAPPVGGAPAFSHMFNYHEMQYITVSPLTAPPALASVTGHRLMNARRRTGSFESSDATLNGVYTAFVDTYVGLAMQGYTVDCPHRERQGCE